MAHPSNPSSLIKVISPVGLKNQLEQLATLRNISLSALVRLILTEYVKSKEGA